MSDMDDIEQSIMAALRKAYQLGLMDSVSRNREMEARLEAAEAKLRDVYEGNEPNPIGLAEAKLAKLAELVQRVRDWNARMEHSTVLEHILTKYEVPK